jgi:outer membrane autotransporter protein
VNYSNTQIGDYTENGSTGIELKYNDQWINSLQSVLGVQGSAAFSTSFAVLVPQFNADYIHEFANSQRFIHVQFAQDLRGTPGFPGTTPRKFTFQNDVPVRNYFNLGTGLVMVLPNGWQFFTNFRAMVGNEHFNNYAGTFGLRVAL